MVDTNYVLDDDGHWVTRYERAEQLARRGILYGGFAKSKTESIVVTPYYSKKYIYYPYEGFDRKKFPNTFKCLLLLYNMPDWHTGKIAPGPFPDLTNYGKPKEAKEANIEDQKEESWYEYYE